MSAPIRVLLVDDQALVRSGFAMILSVEDDIEVVGQASNGREALDILATHPADVVLMDVQMPVMNGIAATREVVATEAAKVIVLTTFDHDEYLFDALRAGASGFLLKNADPEDLVEAVRAVARGHALLSPEVTLKVIARLIDSPAIPVTGSTPVASDAMVDTAAARAIEATVIDSLSPREREVLGLLAEGLSNAEIATRLFLGESTVKTYVSNVLAKTQSRDRVQVVVFAHRYGLVGGI